MRIMTYNIRIGIQQGVEAIARVINQANPDIVALQEVGKNWNYGPPVGDTMAKLSALTALPYYAFAPALNLPGEGVCDSPDNQNAPLNTQLDAQYGHGLLSRWPITSTRIQPLTCIADEQRTMMTTTVETNQGRLQILSTHLSHRDSDRPTHALELLKAAQKLQDTGQPAIILGDLNEHSDTPWIQNLQKAWSDADQAQNRLTFPADKPRLRLDYMFALNATWQNDVTVIDEQTASDHRPVLASLRLL